MLMIGEGSNLFWAQTQINPYFWSSSTYTNSSTDSPRKKIIKQSNWLSVIVITITNIGFYHHVLFITTIIIGLIKGSSVDRIWRGVPWGARPMGRKDWIPRLQGALGFHFVLGWRRESGRWWRTMDIYGSSWGVGNSFNSWDPIQVPKIYPLVNVYITMENHHFSWENQLFRLGHFQVRKL